MGESEMIVIVFLIVIMFGVIIYHIPKRDKMDRRGNIVGAMIFGIIVLGIIATCYG